VSVLPYLIIVLVLGLVVGRLAPLLVPGPDPIGLDRTALVGMCGALTAGLFSWAVLDRHGWGIFISVLVSMLVVWLYRRPRPAGYRRPRPAEYRGSRPVDNRRPRPAEYRGSRHADNRRPRPADNRGSQPADNRRPRPAEYRGSREPDYPGRTPGGRRPPRPPS